MFRFMPQQSSCSQLDSSEARALVDEKKAIIIDVREPDEYAAGRIPNAEHIPLRQIADRIVELEQHRDRPIILSCRSGNRSEAACRFLRDNGFRNVHNLIGGITAWARAKAAAEISESPSAPSP